MRRHLLVQDDAGVPCEISAADASELPDLVHAATRGALARLRSAAISTPPGWLWLRIVMVLFTMILVPLVVYFSMAWTRGTGLPRAFTLLMVMGFSLAAGWLQIGVIVPRITARTMERRAPLVADFFLRLRRCPRCCYQLDPATADGRGLVGCAECGSCWRRERLGQVEVPNGVPGQVMGFRTGLVSAYSATKGSKDAHGRPFRRCTGPMATDGLSRFARRALRRESFRHGAWIIGCILLMISAPPLAGLVAGKLAMPWMFIVGGLICVPFIVTGVVASRRLEALALRNRLRLRFCLACHERLRRSGELLTCQECGAAWKRPARRATLRIHGLRAPKNRSEDGPRDWGQDRPSG